MAASTSRFKPTHRELKSILLYLIDWIFVGGTALVAYSFSTLTPNIRPFSIQDQTISYPFETNAKIPTSLLATLSTIVPGIIIFLIIFLLPNYRSKPLKQKLWMLNTSWLGLGVAVASAMLVTDGMKNLVGKPRPDFLARCDPDSERVGSGEWDVGESGYLYAIGICKSWDGLSRDGLGRKKLLDGFRSWVSGHSSISFGGLTYLSIFLSAHVLWYLEETSPPNSMLRLSSNASTRSPIQRPTNHPSAPLLLLLSTPVLLAAYIGTTRFSDYRHHGVDIILGSLLGIGTAIVGWSWYGSRSIYGRRGFGGFYSSRGLGRDGCVCGIGGPGGVDLEMANHSHNGRMTGTSDEFAVSDAEGLRRFQQEERDNQIDGGETGGVAAAKGALQLREINLSISTLDTPDAASARRVDGSKTNSSAHRYGGQGSSSNPSRTQVLDGASEGGGEEGVEGNGKGSSFGQ